jgi:hypothetical protein
MDRSDGAFSFVESIDVINKHGTNVESSVCMSEMGVRGDRATGCAAGMDLYERNTSPFQEV